MGQTLWVFQGARDEVVLPELPRAMMESLRGLGDQPRYSEFSDAGHDIGSQVYADRDALAWLFSCTQAAPASL